VVNRTVDLETMPLYVRAGSIIPHGPVRQYTGEPSITPMRLVIYPGADGSSTWYEDDGHSFAYRNGDWMKVMMTWEDAARRLTLDMAPGSRILPAAPRIFLVRVAGEATTRPAALTGRRLQFVLT